MFYSLKLYLTDKWIAAPLLISATLTVLCFLWETRAITQAGDQVFLHYNIIFGIDLFGAGWKMIVMPISALFIFLVNAAFAYRLHGSEKPLSRLLVWFSAALILLLAYALTLIIGLNA